MENKIKSKERIQHVYIVGDSEIIGTTEKPLIK